MNIKRALKTLIEFPRRDILRGLKGNQGSFEGPPPQLELGLPKYKI